MADYPMVAIGQEACTCGHVFDEHRADGICDVRGCPCWRYEEASDYEGPP